MSVDLSAYRQPALTGTVGSVCYVVSVMMALATLRGIRGLQPIAIDQAAVGATVLSMFPGQVHDINQTAEALRAMGYLGEYVDLRAVGAVQAGTNAPYDAGLKYCLGKSWPCAVDIWVDQSVFSGGTLTVPTAGSVYGAHAIAIDGYDDTAGMWLGQNGLGTSNGPIKLPYSYFRKQADGWIAGGGGIALISLPSGSVAVPSSPPSAPPPPVTPTVAITATATAAVAANPASNAVDGRIDTWWSAKGFGLPQTLTVNLGQPKTISSVVVKSVTDAWDHPVDPSDTLTASAYVLIDFDVQVGGTTVQVRGNNLAKRTVPMPAPVSAASFSIAVLRSGDGNARIIDASC